MIEIRQTQEYREWFRRLSETQTRVLIDQRLRRVSLAGGDKSGQRRDIRRAQNLAKRL